MIARCDTPSLLRPCWTPFPRWLHDQVAMSIPDLSVVHTKLWSTIPMQMRDTKAMVKLIRCCRLVLHRFFFAVLLFFFRSNPGSIAVLVPLWYAYFFFLIAAILTSSSYYVFLFVGWHYSLADFILGMLSSILHTRKRGATTFFMFNGINNQYSQSKYLSG